MQNLFIEKLKYCNFKKLLGILQFMKTKPEVIFTKKKKIAR